MFAAAWNDLHQTTDSDQSGIPLQCQSKGTVSGCHGELDGK